MRRAALVLASLALLHCKKNESGEGDLAKPQDLRAPRDQAQSGDLAGAKPDLGAAGGDLSVEPPDLLQPALDLLGCTPRSAALAVAAVGNDKSLFTARFTNAGGWTQKLTSTQVSVEELAARGTGKRLGVAVRETGNQLSAGLEVDCEGFSPQLVPLPSASTPVRPALRLASANDVVFRGAINDDHRYYVQRFGATGASAAVTQGNLLSLTTPALYGTADDVGLVFTADDGKLYDGTTSGSGGSATVISGATSTRPPALVELAGGSLLVVFLGDDTNVYFTRRTGSTWSAPKSLCEGQSSCLIASHQPPTLTLDSLGNAVALWIGKDPADQSLDKGVYAALFDSGTSLFGAAAEVTSEVTHDPVAAAPGIDGASVEVAWVRDGDGFLRHGRLVGTWQAPTTVEAKAFRTRPELVLLK